MNTKLWPHLSLLLTLGTSRVVKADDDLNKIYSLAEDVRSIVLETKNGKAIESGKFSLTTNEADQIAALSSMDDLTRSYLGRSLEDAPVATKRQDCDQYVLLSSKSELKKRVEKRGLTLEAVVLSSNNSYEQIALGKFDKNDYTAFMNKAYWNGNYNVIDIYSIDWLQTRFRALNPSINLNTLTLSEKEDKLFKFINDQTGLSIPKDILIKELAFYDMIQHPEGWKKTLQEAKDHLSTEQKIQLVSKIGAYFSSNYNYARNEAKKGAYGTFIDAQNLLKSVQTSTPGGVCRDIALAQTQFLKELGFKDNYVISYRAHDSHHATVIATNPETKEVVKFNYSEVYVSPAKSGTPALNQDTTMPDFGLGFKIYDTNGKPVAKISNEITQILQNVTAAQERNFSERTYSISKVGFQSKLGSGNIFSGKTSEGLRIYGVALHSNQIFEYGKISSGVAISKLSGERSKMAIDQTSLYARANAEINTPALKIGSSETKAIAGFIAEGLISNNEQKSHSTGNIYKASNQFAGDLDGYLGVETKVVTPEHKTTIDGKVYINFYPDLNHVATAEKIIAAKNNITVQTGVTHQMTKDTKALIDTAVIMRNYGTDIVIKAMLDDEKRGIRGSIGGSTPISKDMPSFLPGGQKRMSASLEKYSGDYIFTIEVERNLTNKSTSINAKAQGNF